MLTSLAIYFHITTDTLLEFDQSIIDLEVNKIVEEAIQYRRLMPKKAEEMYREGLKKYPNHHVLLNCLLYVLDCEYKRQEKIDLAQKLIRYANEDCIKYDAIRVLAGMYAKEGNQELTEYWINQIPEIYFTKLELEATLLQGEKKKEAALKEVILSLEILLEMLNQFKNLGEDYTELGKEVIQCFRKDNKLIFSSVLDAMEKDFLEEKIRFMEQY
jgi:hypothetical protein